MSEKRVFRLPNIEELTKQQEKVRALPVKGAHLIVGGPGTGKSVVALLRCKKLSNEQKDYHCLAFNHILLASNKKLSGGEIKSGQWQSWFNWFYKKALNQKSVPRLPESKNGWKNYDWQAIINHIKEYQSSNGDKKDFSDYFLVIDEGQDMPKEFYETLIEIGVENFFVVADQNQRITEHNSSIYDLKNELGLDVDEKPYELTDNFRNNYGIARLCQEFYTDPATPMAELPTQQYNAQRPTLFGYEPHQFHTMIGRILKNAINSPRELIGIICPNITIAKAYYNELKTLNNQSSDRVNIAYYDRNDRADIDFGMGGIVILQANNCKGLEFDTVFCADINEHKTQVGNIDGLKKRFYVMCSRARDRLFLLINKSDNTDNINTVMEILPTDTQILERKNV